MKNRFLVGLVVCILGISGTANAFVMDFEDITMTQSRNNFPQLGIQNTYAGFQWPSESIYDHWGVVNNADGQFSTVGAFSGTQAVWNWSNSDIRNIIFDQLYDVHGAYFNVFAELEAWGAEMVQFKGYDAGGNLVGTTANLALEDGVASPPWKLLTANLLGVKRLEIVSTGGWWAMDDLSLSVSNSAPVPEPATVALLGIGLAGLAGVGVRRKLKSKAVEKS